MEEDIIFNDIDRLTEQALQLLKHSYAPYSNFHVIAFVLAQSKTNPNDKRMFDGVNIECASYSLCICAERVAISKAISSGYSEILKVVVISTGDKDESVGINFEECWPCGACRQFIAEFSTNSQCKIFTIDKNSRELVNKTIDELLPNSFKLIK